MGVQVQVETVSALVIKDKKILVETCRQNATPYAGMFVLPTAKLEAGFTAEECLDSILLHLIFVPTGSVSEYPIYTTEFSYQNTVAHLYLVELAFEPDVEKFLEGVMFVSLDAFIMSLINHDYPPLETMNLLGKIQPMV